MQRRRGRSSDRDDDERYARERRASQEIHWASLCRRVALSCSVKPVEHRDTPKVFVYRALVRADQDILA